jgi:cystathionine beta-lyase
MVDFDEEINRIGTNSSKYDNMERLYGVAPDTGLSMWTADMDFRAPKCITEALGKLIEHGIFGYYGDQINYNIAVTNWYSKRHSWEINPSWISVCHGLVAGIGIAIRAFSKPGDGVIIFTPVYHSFISMVKANNRYLNEQSLYIEHGEYFIDFDKLEKGMVGNEKILLFCSPHNPGGKVWSVNELEKIGAFCEKHDLILISDEIHNDLVYSKSNHTVYPIAVTSITKRLVVLASASKTFNIAGGETGNVIIEDEKLRKKFNNAHKAIGTTPNLFGMKIAESAYLYGEKWLESLLPYLESNKVTFDLGISKIPGLNSMHLSSTYLAWVDFSQTGLPEQEIIERVHKKAKIAASVGSTFGKGGELFMRFNLACPKAKINEAISRLEAVFYDM